MQSHDLVAAFAALLEKEAAALRVADFDALAALRAPKEELAMRLDSELPADAPGLAELGARARRNALSLRAAIGGVKAARRRVIELARVADGTGSYGSDGRTTRHPVKSGRLERRA